MKKLTLYISLIVLVNLIDINLLRGQFTINQTSIIDGTEPGLVYVLFDSPFTAYDIRSIYWDGPSGFHETGMMLSVSEPGEYCVTIINTEFCIAQACINVKLCKWVKLHNTFVLDCGKNIKVVNPPAEPVTGGGHDDSKVFINSVYPNPFNESLTVEIISPIEQNAKIKLINSTGELIFETEAELFQGINSFTYQISGSLPLGMFYLSLIDGQGVQQGVKQVIRQ
jgi:Secretion system C-terminal sorting domain